MNKILPLSFVACSFILQLHANDTVETQEQRERLSSVKKAVQSVAQTPQKEQNSITSEPQTVSDITTENTETKRERIPSVKKAISGVSAVEQKDIDIVWAFQHMFRDGKVTGQIRSMFSSYDNKEYTNTSATALGGFVKYELAQYKGFSGAVAFHTSTDIDALSSDGEKRNTELSSAQQEYEVRSETYINYNYNDKFNLRIGRQIIDTPLADSDDIRMIPNSFQAAVADYDNESLHVTLGALQKWQGSDAGLDDGWQKTGKDGTYFGGLSYSYNTIEMNLWVYNINGEADDATANNSFYIDVMDEFSFTETLSLHVGAQYLKQNELDNSGVKADIYGATGELVIDNLGLNLAYNHANKQSNKQSFSGFGGGTLFTNMDSMILDAITYDRSVDAYVAGLSYTLGDFNLLYAYGDFVGAKDSTGAKAEVTEQDFGIEYSKTDEFTLAAIYTLDNDKYDNSQNGANGGDWGNLRIFAAYNF